MHDATSVDSALALLRQHLARPSGIFDPHAALTAVDQLTDVARDKSEQRASRFGVILCQTRPLLHDSAFQQLLLKMVGDKEVAMAKEIQKVLKRSLPQYQPRDERMRSYPYPRGSILLHLAFSAPGRILLTPNRVYCIFHLTVGLSCNFTHCSIVLVSCYFLYFCWRFFSLPAPAMIRGEI